MEQQTKPAAGNGGHREITIRNWKAHSKGTLVGFFTVVLPSGLILHDLMLHQRDESRWVGFPSREWTDASGQRQYSRLVEFRDRRTADHFRDLIVAALDAHLAAAARP
jgi:DNA-binding cell septation regulator SpoVG